MNPSLLPVLLESAMRALIAALAVWAGLRVFRVRNVLVQKAAWGLLLIAALAMPLLMKSPWLPSWAAVKLPAPSWARTLNAAAAAVPSHMASQSETPAAALTEPFPSEVTSAQPESEAPISKTDELPAIASESLPAPVAAPAQPASLPSKTSALTRVLAATWNLYLGVSAILLARLLWGLALSLWLWVRANAVETPPELAIPASIRVRWSPRIPSPVNIGSGILLPADYLEWGEEKLRVVLAHERSHICQRDFYLQLAAGIYAALTWFSPLGWWLKRKLSELSEAISDHAGLAVAESPSAYAGMLLEFAALPRRTLQGVAMAQPGNLSHRIERFLNDSSFRLAFAGGRRALLSLWLPVVLIAAVAMVRVQTASAAGQANASQPAAVPQDQAPSQSSLNGQSNPQPAQVTDAGAGQAPPSSQNQEPSPAPPMPAAAPSSGPAASPAPQAPEAPEAGAQEPLPAPPSMPAMPPIHVDVNVPPIPVINAAIDKALKGEMYAYAGRGPCFADGDSYAIVGDPGSQTRFCGDWDDEGTSDVDKARSQAHGHFLLFRHEGKLYIVDDPATVSELETIDKSRDALSDQMRALGKQMRDAGQQAREAARKARETAQNIPAPDLSKEIAALEATAASMKDKQGGTVSREQLQELQREVSAIQRRVIEAEVGVNMKEFNEDMAKFGQEQGKYGEQMGQLGKQMGQMARENSQKIRSTIDDSLKNGKARPVN